MYQRDWLMALCSMSMMRWCWVFVVLMTSSRGLSTALSLINATSLVWACGHNIVLSLSIAVHGSTASCKSVLRCWIEIVASVRSMELIEIFTLLLLDMQCASNIDFLLLMVMSITHHWLLLLFHGTQMFQTNQLKLAIWAFGGHGSRTHCILLVHQLILSSQVLSKRVKKHLWLLSFFEI